MEARLMRLEAAFMLHGWSKTLLSCTGGREAVYLQTLPAVIPTLLDGAHQLHSSSAAAVVMLGHISKTKQLSVLFVYCF